MAPQIVLTDRSLVPATHALMTQAGWTLVDEAPVSPWDLASHPVAVANSLAHTNDISSVTDAAARGAGTVTAGEERSLLGQLLDDLIRIGRVDVWTLEERPPVLSMTARDIELLGAMARGRTLGEAAQQCYLSRRTADRRLAATRQQLGVGSTTEALCLIGAMLDDLAPS